MDPITHGITGALLGKGFFSKRAHRIAIFAATLGAVFPDIDVFYGAHDPFAIIKYHRNITHSFVCLPAFALLLAWITHWIARRFKLEAPGFWLFTAIYAAGIASHIILDAMTSFGTRIWAPISEQRVAWDLLFIIDFTFTAIVLLPQIAAWVYSKREKNRVRATSMWVLFTLAGFVAWRIAAASRAGFHFYITIVASAIMALLFFAPAIHDWGFRTTRAGWCQAGIGVMVAYLFACALGHRTAMRRVENFANVNRIPSVRIGALPMPPSLLTWGDAIKTRDGVYRARVDLRDSTPPDFRFIADSPPDAFTARALELPQVQLYWTFARFPVIHASTEDALHVIDFGDNRFVTADRRTPQPFTYRVAFDSEGNVVEQGWLGDGMRVEGTQKAPPAEGKR